MIRWGILGLGRAATSFAEAIKEVENAKIISISSHSKKKLSLFGKKFNIIENYRFNTYQELINCEEIDAVYIGTLNNTHADLIIKSAKANKGILCEKPMAMNENQAKQVFIQLAKSKVFFLEAIAYRAHPQTKILNKLILDEEIGKIETIKSNFTFKVNNLIKLMPKHRLFNKKLGGGAILDIGCYPSSFSLLIAKLLQKKEKKIKFELENINGKINFRGTDDQAYTKIIFEDLFEAEFNIAINKKADNFINIYGSKGQIIIRNPWLPPKKSFIEVFTKTKSYVKEVNSKYSIYANCIRFASNSIEKKTINPSYPLMTWEDSMINMQILNQWKNKLYDFR